MRISQRLTDLMVVKRSLIDEEISGQNPLNLLPFSSPLISQCQLQNSHLQRGSRSRAPNTNQIPIPAALPSPNPSRLSLPKHQLQPNLKVRIIPCQHQPTRTQHKPNPHPIHLPLPKSQPPSPPQTSATTKPFTPRQHQPKAFPITTALPSPTSNLDKDPSP